MATKFAAKFGAVSGIPVLKMRLRVQGLKAFEKYWRRAGRAMEDAIGYALYEEGKMLWRTARSRCPVWTGTMRESHYVTLPDKIRGAIAVEVGAGGWAQDYTLRQHEDTTLRHRVGEAKWLEKSLKALMIGFEGRTAARTRLGFARHLRARQDPRVITDPFQGPDLRPEHLRKGPARPLER